jgi:UDP:flavonoid glycosyltransferase YjiC (YdhE family)
MKVMFVSIGSYGMLMPLLGAAAELAQRGHTSAIVTHRRGRALVERAGFDCIEGASGEQGLNIEGWWTPRQAVPQFQIVRDAIDNEQPNVLVVDHLAVGAIMAARASGVPVAVLGPAAYLHPIAGLPADTPSARIRNGRYARLVEGYNESAQILGLPPASALMDEDSPFLGDQYLLRSVPAFEACADALPHRVRYVGACLSDSNERDAALATWIENGETPIAFVQIEKLFDFDDPVPVLLECLEERGLRTAAALGENVAKYREQSSPALFLRAHLPQGQVLASSRLAISTGHAMAVLGAIRAGVPSAIVDFGSGAAEILHCCVSSGIGAGLAGMKADKPSVAALLDSVLDGDAMPAKARRMQRSFADVDSFSAIADVLDELTRAPSMRRRSSSV